MSHFHILTKVVNQINTLGAGKGPVEVTYCHEMDHPKHTVLTAVFNLWVMTPFGKRRHHISDICIAIQNSSKVVVMMLQENIFVVWGGEGSSLQHEELR